MSEIPTTENIISAYVWAVDMDDAESREIEARLWLEDTIAKAKAEALREASSFVTGENFTFRDLNDVRAWLRNRANGIYKEEVES